MGGSILLAGPEGDRRRALRSLLESDANEVAVAGTARAALEAAAREEFELIALDLRLGERAGRGLAPELRAIAPEAPLIVLAGRGQLGLAMEAMRGGASDYLVACASRDEVVSRARRAIELGRIRRDCRATSAGMAASCGPEDLVGASRAAAGLRAMARKLSEVRSSLLIAGEAGTGRELLARAIHFGGAASAAPFVTVSCGAVGRGRLETELMGWRGTSDDGEVVDRFGAIESACGGTLFLDEVGLLPPRAQNSLLRVLEEGVVTPVGDTRARAVDVRVVGATSQDLDERCRAGRFREDLLYRLGVVRLRIPPLRERREDIVPLAARFVRRHARASGRPVEGLTGPATRALLGHEWPGNVPELESVIERAVVLAEGREIGVGDLPFSGPIGGPEADGEDLREAMSQYERQHILGALRRHRYDKPETARRLGIGVSSLYRKLGELGIPKDPRQADAARGAPV
jgi:DNA-binding NtrC family response regulator